MTRLDNPTTSPLLKQWSRLLSQIPEQRPLWVRLLVAAALTVLALWLRLLIGPIESGARFATLTLAVVVSGIFGGFSAGLLSTVLGLVLANFFLIGQAGQAAVADLAETLWLNLTFLLTQMVVLGAIWVMQQRNGRLREMTQLLTDSHRRFQDSFEHAAAGITHVGLKGELLAINQNFCQLVGYNVAELREMSFQDITDPEDIGPDVQLLEQAVAGGRSHYSLEKRYIHKDGHTIWAQLTVALMRTPEGAPDYFISVVQDISGVKSTEAALRTSERLMQEAEAAGKLLTWEADVANLRFRTFGKSRRWLGLASREFGPEEIMSRTHPDDHMQMLVDWESAIKAQEPCTYSYRGHPDSDIRWFNVVASFEVDEHGRTYRAYGVAQDISEHKLAQLEIQRLNASLEQRIQERTQELKHAYDELESYSYAVAHDLRSPLRIINGFAQALEEDNAALDSASQVHIQRIKGSSKKMGLLIDGLLQLSQYARGEVVRQPVNLSAAVTRLLEDMANDEPDRKVDWSVEANLTAHADPSLLDAVLQNLLHNAWKYTAKTANAEIRFEQREFDGTLMFCVSDNGAGFDMNRASKLFQPFQRLHMPHEFGGLGVGLATARRIVQRHGGQLLAQGTPGQGASFYFTLPFTNRAKAGEQA